MTKIDPAIFKAYDIRGIYPNQLNEETIYKISKGIFTFFVKKLNLSRPPRLVLSYDGRLSTPSLVKEVRRALLESGAEIIEIGLSSTPTFYFAVTHYNYDGGLQISASHNPKNYNGIKFALNTSSGITKIGKDTGISEVRAITIGDNFVSLKKEGTISQRTDVLENQIKNAFEMVENPKIGNLKIVADPANAVGALYLKSLFEKLPGELIEMNFKIDGNFPAHQPDPLQFDKLKDLQKRILEEKADLGVAPDGDGDRIFFINEKGEVIQASLITALVAKELLKAHPGEKIVVDVRNTLTVEAAVKKFGGTPVLTRVGHALITETMKNENAIFAGENSGHYFFRQTGFAEDPLPVILTILSVLTRESKPISEVLKPLAVGFESGEINFKTNNGEKIKQETLKKYREGKVSLLDGVSIDYPNWRFNIRSSNTEPLLRLNIESVEKGVLEQKKKELLTFIEGLL